MKKELKNITARELIRALEKTGFARVKKRGGHLIYRHTDGRRVSVPFHGSGDILPVGTLSSILHGAGWSEEDLRRLRLLK